MGKFSNLINNKLNEMNKENKPNDFSKLRKREPSKEGLLNEVNKQTEQPVQEQTEASPDEQKSGKTLIMYNPNVPPSLEINPPVVEEPTKDKGSNAELSEQTPAEQKQPEDTPNPLTNLNFDDVPNNQETEQPVQEQTEASPDEQKPAEETEKKKTEEPKNQQTKAKPLSKPIPTTAKKPESFNLVGTAAAIVAAAALAVLAYFGYINTKHNTNPKSQPQITKSVAAISKSVEQEKKADEKSEGAKDATKPVEQTLETVQPMEQTALSDSVQGVEIEKKQPYTPENFLDELKKALGR